MSKADKYDACDYMILQHCMPTSLNLLSFYIKYIVGNFVCVLQLINIMRIIINHPLGKAPSQIPQILSLFQKR